MNLVECLENIYNNCENFENVVVDILEKHNFDNETIVSLLTINHLSSIIIIIDMLKSL